MNKSNSNTLKPLARRFAVVLLLTSLSAGGFAQFPLGGQATNGAQAVPSPQTNTGETPLFRAEQLMLTGSYAAASDIFQMADGLDRNEGIVGASKASAMMGNYVEAIRICESAIEDGDYASKPLISTQLAEVKRAIGLSGEALEILLMLVDELFEPPVRSLVQYGSLLKFVGQRDAAYEVLDRAVQRYNDGLVFASEDVAMVALALVSAPRTQAYEGEVSFAMVRDIVERGASYQRQRAVAAATDGDLVAVVDSVVRELRERLHAGDFGTPRQLRAELGFVVSAGPDDRLLDPALGASALLDMGIYPLTFAHLMLGAPEQLTATASLSEGGIDLDVALAGRYPGGALATMSASMTSWSDRSASIATDTGRVELHGQFHHPDKAVFHPFDRGSTNDVSGQVEPVEVLGREPVVGRGYAHEIAEVDRCVRAGLRESPLVPHDQTLAIMRQLDDVRRRLGVTYPADG